MIRMMKKTKSSIPGVTKSQQKKADRKAKEKAAKTKHELKVKSNPKRKDFVKSKILDESTDVNEEEYVFEDAEGTPKSGSKFFTQSPLDLLSPAPFGSLSAKRIVKEELWKQSVQNNQDQQVERVLSPDDPHGRRTKQRT